MIRKESQNSDSRQNTSIPKGRRINETGETLRNFIRRNRLGPAFVNFTGKYIVNVSFGDLVERKRANVRASNSWKVRHDSGKAKK